MTGKEVKENEATQNNSALYDSAWAGFLQCVRNETYP